MAKAVVKPAGASPSEEVVRDANAVVHVTDARGRKWGVKRLGPAKRMRLFAILGNDLAQNQMYLGHAALAASVVDVDGEEIPFPQTALLLEALVQRMDDDGLEAVAGAIAEHFGVKGSDEVVAAAKN